jgi:transglutaminase-like putative cysteine protease/predicted esterase
MRKNRPSLLPARTLFAASLLSLASVLAAEDIKKDWPTEAEQALARAGDNRPELERAVTKTPREQRQGMAFLIANMPDYDLRSLHADFLLQNVELAYKARQEFPWGGRIPEEIFLNDVLPYANVDEARDPWRKELYELCAPLVKECRTPADAAQRLNQTIFAKLKFRYSTERKQPHQSPKETIAQGKATCTGLSILLCDACRSVGVPARLAGTPLWSDKSGNHTWVEIWSDGWHFTGAAEPDANGLDRAWFQGNAAKAKKESVRHAIYAVSFRRTDLTFPLVWARDHKDVFAVNVTDRYAAKKASTGTPAPEQKTDEKKPALLATQTEQVQTAARAFFGAGAEEQKKWRFEAALDRLLTGHEEAVRRAVWEAYKAVPLHDKAKKDYEQNQVRFQQHVSPYVVRRVGKRPAHGWPLVIAMHGGGGAPQELNDSQWRVMQRYYRDQTSVTGYQYLALRAPNNVWNGFYDHYAPPLIVNLIRQFLLFGDIDPDKVYLIGYSHGGYGAFFIGPKIPDRSAAIHSSAAAPTDGAISPRTLRNTRFTFMVGENDTDYGRRSRCEAFNEQLQKVKSDSKDAFPVEMELKKGFGHRGLPDRDKIKEMYAFTRNPVPRHLTWDLTDPVITHFFWLSVSQPAKGGSIEAKVQDNRIDVTTGKIKQFALNLDSRLIDFSKPLRITLDGKEQAVTAQPSFRTLCESMLERGDPQLAFTCRIQLGAESK